MKKNYIFLFLTLILICPLDLYATDSFFYMGNGKIKIGRNEAGSLKTIKFRDEDGNYIEDGLKKLNSLYGTSWNEPSTRMSLRLIELLDYLEDHFAGRGVRIVSGYRSPTHNESLRKRGKLAASSSQHLDAEAIDIIMGGIRSSVINDYLVPRNCCGVGYYHGKTIHIDTGPPRFWDETTSGTEKKEPPENEHIVIKTKSDIYRPGQKIGLKFSRVNDYPIGVEKKMELICNEGEIIKKLVPEFKSTVKKPKRGCYELKNRTEGRRIFATLPPAKSLKKPVKCHIKATFCEPITLKMPEFVTSNEIIIK